jgi:hypothetical protein
MSTKVYSVYLFPISLFILQEIVKTEPDVIILIDANW